MVWSRALLYNLLRKRRVHLRVGKATCHRDATQKKRISKAANGSDSTIELNSNRIEKGSGLVNKNTGFVGQASIVSRAGLKRKGECCDGNEDRYGPNAKRFKEDPSSDAGRLDSTDRISQLPEHIIHQILSLLHSPKDLTRASILSRTWRGFCSSFFVVMLDQRRFIKGEDKKGSTFGTPHQKMAEDTQDFRDVVARALRNFQDRELSAHKLMLHMTSLDSGLIHNVGELFSFAAESKIKELDLHFPIRKNSRNRGNRRYILPRTVLAASAVTALRLYGCKLGSCHDIKLPNLKNLCLGELYVNESMIQSLIKSCPLLEDLRVIYCTGMTKLQVSDLANLNKLEVHCCLGLNQVQVKTPSLRTFWYRRKNVVPRRIPCTIDLSTCMSLKSLTLEEPEMKDESFQDLLSNFPFLELLELSKCHSLKNITVSGLMMKRLVLRGCKSLNEADIEAPNLRSFEFKGNTKPSLLLNPRSLREVKLAYKRNKETKDLSLLTEADRLWYADLRKFLGLFDQNKEMKLVVRCNKNVIIHEDLTEILLPALSEIEVEVISPSKGFEDILDCVLRTWHPETISLVSSTDSPLLKLMVGIRERGDEQSSCCAYNASNNKCWRHFLKSVKIEELEGAEDVKQSFLISHMKSLQTTLKKTTSFRLNWMSRQLGLTN